MAAVLVFWICANVCAHYVVVIKVYW
jgi:hypothetical protein